MYVWILVLKKENNFMVIFVCWIIYVVKSLLKELLLGFLIKVENCIFKNILKIKDVGVFYFVYKI